AIVVERLAAKRQRFLMGGSGCAKFTRLAADIADLLETDAQIPEVLRASTQAAHQPPIDSQRSLIGGLGPLKVSKYRGQISGTIQPVGELFIATGIGQIYRLLEMVEGGRGVAVLLFGARQPSQRRGEFLFGPLRFLQAMHGVAGEPCRLMGITFE